MSQLNQSRTSLSVKSIILKKRIRKNLGNMDELKASIDEVGLLNPIIVNQKNELLCGERRFCCVKALGWKTIDAVMINTRDALDKLNIEIEENLHRKDFTYSELEEGIERRNKLRKRKEMSVLGYIWSRFITFIIKIIKKFFRPK